MDTGDYTSEAEALFARFAERHVLRYEISQDGPYEVLWEFPAQAGLTLPIILGLQNGDELNFGVSDFWSYFFPYDQCVVLFDQMLDAWIIGEARIAVTGPWGRVLQLYDHGSWRSIYGANRILPFWGKPWRTIENRPLVRRMPPTEKDQ